MWVICNAFYCRSHRPETERERACFDDYIHSWKYISISLTCINPCVRVRACVEKESSLNLFGYLLVGSFEAYDCYHKVCLQMCLFWIMKHCISGKSIIFIIFLKAPYFVKFTSDNMSLYPVSELSKYGKSPKESLTSFACSNYTRSSRNQPTVMS